MRISLKQVLKEVEREEDRGRIAQRIEKARVKSTSEFVFPKLVEEKGVVPRIADDPPLIFHPTAEQTPELETGYREGFAMYRESLPEHIRAPFDRFAFCDLAVKVVGVGSVGTLCGVALPHPRRRPDFPANQGSQGVGARTLCRQERA